MNVIDNLLLEWSYRCPDGVVDMDNYDKILILREILDEESNKALDVFLENVDPSEVTKEAIDYIKDLYIFGDNNFKIVGKNAFRVLLPGGFKLSRTETMSDIEQKNPDFKFDEGSIGKGSSIGRLKYKDKIQVYVKFAKGQGSESAGKVNESAFFALVNSHVDLGGGSITVVLKSSNKEEIFENVTKCIDSSTTDAQDYAKADAQLLSNGIVIGNISLKQRNAIRWESSKRRMKSYFDNFIKAALEGKFENVSLQPIEGTNNKYKLFNPQTNKVLSKVAIVNTPKELDDSVIFGKDNPKTIVVKEDFNGFSDYMFEDNILTIDCYKIYTSVDDVLGTPDEPVFAFSNHIGQAYGIEFRSFSKGVLYSDQGLKGSSAEVNFNDIE
jgi:hypothetical protein